jgi:hypothetical protein
MKRGLWLALVALCGVSSAFGVPASQDEVGLRLEVNKREVEVGDSLTVSLEFRRQGNSGGSVVSENPSIPTLENFEVRGSSSSTRVMMVNNQMSQVSTTNIHLVATKPGEATLGPAIVLYNDAQLGRRELKSNTVVVLVTAKKPFSIFGHKQAEATPPPAPATSAPASPDDLRDIHGLMQPAPFPWGLVFWPLLLIGAGFWAYRLWKRKHHKNIPEGPKGPAEILRERYRVLSRSEANSEEFCRSASALVRSCLQYRYGFPAEDRTSVEVSAELKKLKASEAVRESVEKCLKTCDRVLYAEGVLSSVAREGTLQALSNLLPKVP